MPRLNKRLCDPDSDPIGDIGAHAKQIEAEVTKAGVRWMKSMGWRAVRQHRGLTIIQGQARGMSGRKGQADWRFERACGATIQVFEWEAKATGKKPTKAQLEYLALRRHQGIPCGWSDSLAGLKEIYFTFFPEDRSAGEA